MAQSVLASTPRPVTPAARRQSRRDPRVRFWTIAAAVFLVAALVLGYGQWRNWAYDNWLIHNGQIVDAVILSVGEVERAGFEVPTPADVTIQFDLDGRKQEVPGRIEPADGLKYVSPTQPLRVRVDPARPQKWTARINADPLIRQFVGPGILLLVAIVSGLVALWRRRGILGAWRNGTAVEGLVHSISRSAIAPRCWCARWAIRGGSDRRLFTAYIPQALGDLKKGDILPLIAEARCPQRAVVARLYQENER